MSKIYRYHCNDCGKEFIATSYVGEKVKCEECGSIWVRRLRKVLPEEMTDEELRRSEEEFYRKYGNVGNTERKTQISRKEVQKGLTERPEIKRESFWLTIIGGITDWPGIIGGILGGLVGLAIIKNLQLYHFIKINTVIGGAVLGSLYSHLWKGKGERITAITVTGLVVGGLFGLHPILLGVFVFGGFYFSLSLYAIINKKWGKYILFGIILWFGIHFLCSYLHLVDYSLNSIWFVNFTSLISMPILGTGLMMIPLLNIIFASIGGGIITWVLLDRYPLISSWLARPLFVIPLLSFAGYFIACKIAEGKKPREEYLKEVPIGGLSMAEKQNFPQKVSKDMSIVAFSEKVMIQDLLGALNNRSLLLAKIDSWKARAKAQDQLRAFEMIKEIFQKEAEAVRAYTEAQQARLDFENLREFNQYIQKEKLKSQLAEEKYKQAELEERLKMMKLEERRKRLELQQEIERLKRAQELTESRIERLKKEELEKIDFQEEIRKIKSIKIGERAEYFHNFRKRIKEKYPPEEAKEIIDEFERMLVEESLKEE